MTNPSKKLGVIVGVDGDVSEVGMYHMSNDAQYIWYGELVMVKHFCNATV
jgi:hypothetical protein